MRRLVVLLSIVGLLAHFFLERTPGGDIPSDRLPERAQLSAEVVDRTLDQLGRLPSADVSRKPDYRRDAFGSAWIDTDDNGCNQRDDVLVRDAVKVETEQEGACDHDVLAGTWRDPYGGGLIELTDAKEPNQAQRVQIDHLVPLENAWRSGAWDWTAARRLRYANDLPGLLAVDGPTNASKGSQDPSSWLPARPSAACQYAVGWVRTKSVWQLEVTRLERTALDDLLNRCRRPVRASEEPNHG